jgi:hypothetical protein
MASYLKKEISEWNANDLSKWLLDNKYPGISELCINNSISGYDLFYITDDILKNELGLNSFHERKITMKLIKKLIYEHLKLNIINSNGDNVILTLDNNPNTSLNELNEYIGSMFNINPKDILYKDSTKTEVLSPSVKIVELLILYPRLYKTINIFNMKDYRQASIENEPNDNLESKENESNIINNNNKNIKMNFDYKNDDINDNNEIIYNNERFNRRDISNEENDELNYKERENYIDKESIEENEDYNRPRNKGYNSYINRKNINDKSYQDNYNKQYNNYDKKEKYYDN